MRRAAGGSARSAQTAARSAFAARVCSRRCGGGRKGGPNSEGEKGIQNLMGRQAGRQRQGRQQQQMPPAVAMHCARSHTRLTARLLPACHGWTSGDQRPPPHAGPLKRKEGQTGGACMWWACSSGSSTAGCSKACKVSAELLPAHRGKPCPSSNQSLLNRQPPRPAITPPAPPHRPHCPPTWVLAAGHGRHCGVAPAHHSLHLGSCTQGVVAGGGGVEVHGRVPENEEEYQHLLSKRSDQHCPSLHRRTPARHPAHPPRVASPAAASTASDSRWLRMRSAWRGRPANMNSSTASSSCR